VRVIFVSQEFPPETGWGGIGTYVDVLSRTLAEKGVEVHVLSAVEGQPSSETAVDGVTVHRAQLPRVRGVGRVTGCPETWERIRLAGVVVPLVDRLMAPATVVECPEWRAEGLGLSYRNSIPLVVRLHSSARQLFPFTGQGTGRFGLDGRLAARLEEAAARRAHVVTSTAPNLSAVLPRLRIDSSAAHAIPIPVRLPPRSTVPPSTPPRVTFVGRLEPRKAPDVLLRAAPDILSNVPEARLVFVGLDGAPPGAPCSATWLEAEAARLGVADAVELRGRLDARGVEEEVQKATVCVFPSRWESFGYALAEAAATGRPVVASGIAPFRELVVDGVTGRVVQSSAPSAWAKAILEVLSDADGAGAMGAAGAELVARTTDPARVADLTLEAYEHALARWRQGMRAPARPLRKPRGIRHV
jgi:glycosyltransferase involved in cell wall biosynthesis